MLSDHELIQKVLQGEVDLYSQIISRYKNRIYFMLYRMIGHAQDAQDLTQEVFIKAYYHLEDYQPTNTFTSWLIRIAANHCLDELRKRKKSPNKLSVEEMNVEVATHSTPERILMEKENLDEVSEQIMKLPQEFRVVFLLRHQEQLSYKEISDVLSIPISIVQNRLYHSRKAVRDGLKKKQEGVNII